MYRGPPKIQDFCDGYVWFGRPRLQCGLYSAESIRSRLPCLSLQSMACRSLQVRSRLIPRAIDHVFCYVSEQRLERVWEPICFVVQRKKKGEIVFTNHFNCNIWNGESFCRTIKWQHDVHSDFSFFDVDAVINFVYGSDTFCSVFSYVLYCVICFICNIE